MGWFLFLCAISCGLHLLLFHFPLCTCSSIPLCNHDDSSALLQLKNSFVLTSSASDDSYCSSPSPKTASWQNGTDCCGWDGVTCDTKSGHVIGLDLSCTGLQGEFHPNSTVFQLTHLEKLNLALNNISGTPLFTKIGDLVALTHLNLSHSSFDGVIPSEIARLSKLVSLDLSWIYSRLGPFTWNKLILNATNLRELFLDGVDMSAVRTGSLSLLVNLSSSLVSLGLGATRLQGNLPSNILCLPNLQELDLSSNQMLKGHLPKSNWSTPLKYLNLSGTAFSGEIPDSIGLLKSVNVLDFTACYFHGLIPVSLWNLTQLTSFSIASNNIIGEIPLLLSNLQHLTFLELQGNNFSGHFPDVFGKITRLQFFSVSGNQFTGPLPLSSFNLTQISFLDFSNNQLIGPIPNKTSELSKLQFLNLGYNLLGGTIPHWCYSLPSLSELDLSGNQLTGSIGEFSAYSLEHLSLSDNKLHGNIPNSMFELKNLTDLSLSSNNLSGRVDFHQFSKFKNLISLDLSHNAFLSLDIDDSVDYISPNLQALDLSSCSINTFPKFLAPLIKMEVLDLSYGNISGKIPTWFHKHLALSWHHILYVDLSFNKLEGEVPIPPPGTYFFTVSNNNLSGDISSTICNATFLFILNLSHNNLTGTIPQCLGTFQFLEALDLQMNNLHGIMPRHFSETSVFRTIKFNGNQLEGPLPQSLANCTQLEVLDLGDNNIEDTFPSWLENLPELQVLSLRSNKFHGTITCFNTKHSFSKLRIFDVSNNNFTGPLPESCIKNFQGMMNVNEGPTGLNYMTDNFSPYNDSIVVTVKGVSLELVRILTTFITFDLSNNMFEGEIPKLIGELNSLKGSNLSHNGITGTIPQSLANVTSLEWLDLSCNKLTGEIPMALADLTFLSVLNLSQNQLQGVIPTGRQFNTFGNDSYLRNPMLCGFPLSKSCNEDKEQPKTFLQHEEESGFGWKPVAVGYACGMVFGMLLGCLVFWTGRPQWLVRLFEGVPNKRVRRTNNRAHASRRRMN